MDFWTDLIERMRQEATGDYWLLDDSERLIVADEIERLQSAIKNCPHGPCPVLAALALEELEGGPDF